jgi:hypothetical protein
MSTGMVYLAAGGAFMTKTVSEAKTILENMLQNFSQWHTERAPTTSSKKGNYVKKVDPLTAKVDAIYSYISKQNTNNVPLQDLVGNNAKNIEVNYIRKFGNNRYGNNYNNSYARPPYAPNNYGNRPFVLYPNANDSQNKY